jgi:hypothetical protein
MGGFFTPVLAFAQELLELKEKLTNAKKNRREKIAGYLEAIANTSDEMLSLLKSNQAPHGPFKKIKIYKQQLPQIIGKSLPEENITALDYWLDVQVTALDYLRDFKNPDYRNSIEVEFTETSGMLRALAESLRAQK